MTLGGKVSLKIEATGQKALDLSIVQDPLNILRELSFTSGTGNDQFDLSFHDKRTLTSGQSEDVDVKGVLEDTFGDVLNFVEIGVVYIKNTSTTDTLKIGGAASNALALFADASDKMYVQPEGFFLVALPNAGIAVATNDKLKVEHTAATSEDLIYEIVILGRSA